MVVVVVLGVVLVCVCVCVWWWWWRLECVVCGCLLFWSMRSRQWGVGSTLRSKIPLATNMPFETIETGVDSVVLVCVWMWM